MDTLSKETVLIVEDEPTNLAVLSAALENAGYKVAIATRGRTALAQLNHISVSLILLDVVMPELDGFETCRLIKANPGTRNIPIILMTSLTEVADKIRGFTLGAVDYITKPLQKEEVLARVGIHLKLASLMHTLAAQNSELQQLTNQLEHRVEARTAELSQALQTLQAAQTELKLANTELEEYTATLLQITRMKDEFLANMSHELRTPLNAILGLTEGLQEEVFGDINEQQEKALQTIEASGTHLLALIDDVLDVAKIESGQIQLNYSTTKVEPLCQSSVALVKQQALKKQIHLKMQISSDITDWLVDERRIRQVLINLLNNAVKFTPEGGQVTLAVTLESTTHFTHSMPYSLRLTVIDTGIGIASEHLAKLFLPFTQIHSGLNRQYTGTGLGLALVKQIVDLHGGTVGVESEVGVGSRFWIDLPWPSSSALSDQGGDNLSHKITSTNIG